MARQLDNIDEIRSVALALLRKADAAERLPTPVDDIVRAAGLIEADDYILSGSKIIQAPREIRRLLRSAGRKVSGVLDRRERIIHVNPTIELPARRSFIKFHETMHDALPWQRDLLVLGDTNRTLAPEIEIVFEREANQGAAELLFQLDLLGRVARDYPTDVSTPLVLADLFGASIHATFRRWIEVHPGAVCGLALDPEPVSLTPLAFRRFELVTSSGWRQRFGASTFPTRLNASNHPFVAPLAPPRPGQIDAHFALSDRAGDSSALRVQSFCNSYRVFVLIWSPSVDGFVARHRRRARLEVG